MTLHWGGSSYPQRSPCIVARCTQAYHISCLSYIIEGKDVDRCTAVSLSYHHILCIRFFVYFCPHCRNADTTISACEFIFWHVLPRYIPGMIFSWLHHFGTDEEAEYRQMVIRPPLLRDWTFEWTFFLLHCHNKSKYVWAQWNSFVTFRRRQCHYFHCPSTYPSGGGTSSVYGPTTCQASVLSRLRSQKWQYLV